MDRNTSHRELVEQNYEGASEYFREKFRDSIIKQKIVEGMWPTEALLAGGGGVYKVKSDENVWPKGSNPMEVMRAQGLAPDDSDIKITFQNSQQFENGQLRKFTVYFDHGVVTDIKEK